MAEPDWVQDDVDRTFHRLHPDINPLATDTSALRELMEADEAHHLEIGYEDGLCVAVATIDDGWDEIGVYEDGDLSPEVAAEADALDVDKYGDDGAVIWPLGAGRAHGGAS